MKKLLLVITMMLLASNVMGAYGIVNNSGTTPADSISIPFFALDTVGNVVAMASGDSVFFNVYYPSGGLAYRDSLAYNGTKITSQTVSDYTEYTWKEAIADIDGTPVNGVYSYHLMVNDQTGADLATAHTGTFQLITETDYHTSMAQLTDIFDGTATVEANIASATSNSLDLADFNGPTAWWNEGKTAYSLTTQDWTVVGDLSALALEASLFDYTTDSVIIDISSAMTKFADSLAAHTADSAWVEGTRTLTVADWTVVSDLSALALEASLFDGNLNLDNATGTLSDAQIDDIVVTAGTVTDKTDYALVTDAINVTTLAASGIGELLDSLFETRSISDTGNGSYMGFVIWQGLQAQYQGGIWIDDAAANTNVVSGVDGTRDNPVSTLAAATTIAGNIGVQRFYFVNNTSATIAQTYNGYEFVGVGTNNSINMGGQDVDDSRFQNVVLTGVQGGTELIHIERCYINGADSLEALVSQSWLTGNFSVKVATGSVFDQCASAVAGNSTPQLDFNEASGVITLSFRHYSGGLEVLGMTSNHTISYETDGQLIVNADCVSANISARGNMTITDNGTTTSLTDDAVWNETKVALLALEASLFDYTADAVLLSTASIDLLWEYDTTNISVASSMGRVTILGGDTALWYPGQALLDTILLYNGFKATAFSYQYISADRDTLVLGLGTDTLIDVIYYHIGGSPGGVPDSTRTQAHP